MILVLRGLLSFGIWYPVFLRKQTEFSSKKILSFDEPLIFCNARCCREKLILSPRKEPGRVDHSLLSHTWSWYLVPQSPLQAVIKLFVFLSLSTLGPQALCLVFKMPVPGGGGGAQRSQTAHSVGAVRGSRFQVGWDTGPKQLYLACIPRGHKILYTAQVE